MLVPFYYTKDILLDPCHSNSDVIVITETWLTDNIKTTSLEHFKTHNIYRVDKPGNKTCRTAGGTAIMAKQSLSSEQVLLYKDNFLQITVIKVNTSNGYLYITAIYNSPNQQNPSMHCRDKFCDLIETHPYIFNNSIITGDIKQDISLDQSSVLHELFFELWLKTTCLGANT
ncbi:unnamed protein product [Mytilus edulis]|uniref:Uncharacterized protein n=1 Tax=Mytilus edulis TaxID=6550 RepID=A0A8S3R528_MYTED|nr:unnamed protein product [Mytilus edulis]